ncbi:MAG: hypothetical protein ACK4KT_08060 [Thermaurantimonas sp.]
MASAVASSPGVSHTRLLLLIPLLSLTHPKSIRIPDLKTIHSRTPLN